VYTVRQPVSVASGGVAIFRESLCFRSADEPLRCEPSGRGALIQGVDVVRINERVGPREILEVIALLSRLRGSRETLYALYADGAGIGTWDAPSRFTAIVRVNGSRDAEGRLEYALVRDCKVSRECTWQVNGPKPYFMPIP
jgi:hypothetical protein